MIKRLSQSSPMLFVGWTSLVVGIVLLSVAPSSTSAFVIPGRRASSRSRSDSQGIDNGNPQFLFTRSTRSRLQRSNRSPKLSTDLSVNIEGPKGPIYLEEKAVLECTSFGIQGMPSLYWLKNGEPIPQSENLVSNSVNENVKDKVIVTEVRSKIFLDCVSAADEAEYTCVAVGSDRKFSATYKLQVSQAPAIVPSQYCRNSVKKSVFRPRTPARINMYTYNKMATIGANVVLACRVQGSNVALSWYSSDDNENLKRLTENSRFHFAENGDLEIKNIQWEDLGGYTCIAENEVGSDRQDAFLYPLASSPSGQSSLF